MITIDKAFYSRDKSTIDVIIRTSDIENYPLTSIESLIVSKEDGDSNSVYIYNKTIDNIEESAIISINIVDDLDHFNSETNDFVTTGITTVKVDYSDNQSSYSFYDETEFYTHKIKLLNVNCDIVNIQKISKKINTYVFLEQLLISALSNNYIDDAKLYYSEMLKLSIFGYSDVIQNNPNSIY